MPQQNRSFALPAVVFPDTKTFNKHLQEVHSLPPVTQSLNLERKLPHESGFGGKVQTYFLEANDDHDFLQFMLDRKPTIHEIIVEGVQAEAKKSAAISESQITKTCFRR